MDLLLIKVPYRLSDETVISGYDYDAPPLGIFTLKAYLTDKGYDVEAYHVANQSDFQYVKNIIVNNATKLIGLSATTYEYIQAINMAKVLKKINRNIPIIIGGPHVSFNYEEALENEEIDVVSRFEGEETLAELLEQYDGKKFNNLDTIRGIAYRTGKKVCVTSERELIDLNSIPEINYSDIKLERYKKRGILMTSRGCVGRCIFCTAAGGKYRERSAENVFHDMEELYYKYGITQINILDNSFTINRSRTEKICDLIIKNQLPIRWDCETRIEVINAELLQLMKDAGCYAIQYGIESANDKTLENIRKGIDAKGITKAIELALKVGIDFICCNYIIGLPGDTVASLEKTFSYMREYKGIKSVKQSVSVLTPYPGTYIYNHAEELGIKILTKDWRRYNGMDVVCETKNLSENQIRDIYYKAYHEFYIESYKEYI